MDLSALALENLLRNQPGLDAAPLRILCPLGVSAVCVRSALIRGGRPGLVRGGRRSGGRGTVCPGDDAAAARQTEQQQAAQQGGGFFCLLQTSCM